LIRFEGEESNHLVRVLRASEGDRFFAFDGSGAFWKSEIVSIHRAEVVARVLETSIDDLPVHRIAVAIATVKAARMDWAVEKAAELGAARFVPLETRYSVVEPGQGKLKRWRTIALSAAKQTRQSRIMEVADSIPLTKFFSQISDDPTCPLLLLLDEKEDKTALLDVWTAKHRTASVILFIGPEGGWSDEERTAFHKLGAVSVSIGRRIMRTETAVVVGLGLLTQTGAGC